jgi:hypothetical protein
VSVFDSYGRIQAGFIEGTLTDLGEFSECLSVDIPVGADDTLTAHTPIDSSGKYCLLELGFPMPDRTGRHVRFDQPVIKVNESDPLTGSMWGDISKHMNGLYTVKSLRIGICVPSTCQAEEVEAVFKRGQSTLFPLLTLNLNSHECDAFPYSSKSRLRMLIRQFECLLTRHVSPLMHTAVLEPLLLMPVRVGPDNECSMRNERVTLTTHQKVGFALYALVISVCLTGTLLDLFATASSSGSSVQRLLICFSVVRNMRRLLHVQKSPSNSKESDRVDLRCVHGLRVLSMFWIIVGHTYFFGAVYQISYALKKLIVDVPRYPGQMIYQPLTNTYLVVDSFFFIGYAL